MNHAVQNISKADPVQPMVVHNQEPKRKPRQFQIAVFFRALFFRPDLDYATFERLEKKRSSQEMKRNGFI